MNAVVYKFKSFKCVKCVKCQKNIFSIRHNCRSDHPAVWINCSIEARNDYEQHVRIPNAINLLKKSNYKIFRLVETEYEYNLYKNSTFSHTNNQGIMYVELIDPPFTLLPTNNMAEVREWIRKALTRYGKPFVPHDRSSTPLQDFWALDF